MSKLTLRYNAANTATQEQNGNAVEAPKPAEAQVVEQNEVNQVRQGQRLHTGG